jgi:hypothetical protein
MNFLTGPPPYGARPGEEDKERRALVEALGLWVTVYPDHGEVDIADAPPLLVLYGAVGLKVREIVGVEGPTRQGGNLALALELGHLRFALRRGLLEEMARLAK